MFKTAECCETKAAYVLQPMPPYSPTIPYLLPVMAHNFSLGTISNILVFVQKNTLVKRLPYIKVNVVRK